MDSEFNPNNIQEILKFLPIFDEPGFVFTRPDPEGGWEYWEAPELNHFVSTLYKTDFLVEFSWPDWQDKALQYYKNPSLLEHADLTTIRKLLTLHVRKDRFFDGHLSSMCEDGHIQSILRRLEIIFSENL